MKTREIFKSPLTQLAAATAAALFKTAILDHRESTHRSLETGTVVRNALELAGAPFTDNKRWAAAHRIHHGTADANMLPFIELADFVKWRQQNPDSVAARVEMPEFVAGLDPAMPEIALEDAVRVGELARQLVEGQYEPQADYNINEATRLMHGTEERYLYESPKGDKTMVPTLAKDGKKPTLWDLRYLLRDPHSPALHPDGLRGVAVQNRHLYDDVVTFFTRNPQFMPEDLKLTSRDEWTEKNKKKVRLGFVATMAAARIIAEQPRTGKEFAASSARGAAIAGLATTALIFGGNIVNSLGHGGQVPFFSKDFVEDVATGKVRVKSNGRYTTNSTVASIATVGSIVTLDEVGRQLEHHDDPGLIAYTHKQGVAGFIDAPFGKSLEFLATRNIGMSVGKGFVGRRPDLPSDAVLLVEELRREYIASHSEA